MHDIAKHAPAGTDWAALRRDFPILDQQVHGKPLVYLDSAASSQRPQVVIDAISHYYERDHSNVHRGIHELSNRATAAYEAARVRTAEFINANSPNEIVFTKGTTESINLVATSWGAAHVKAGDVILLTELEHHANIIPWQLLAGRTGAKLRYIPVLGDSGVLDLSKLDELLTPEVKMFAFCHISNTMGTINPAAELCARARALGIADAGGRRAVRRALSRGRAGPRLRLPGVQRPQDSRPHRHGRALRARGGSPRWDLTRVAAR